MLSRRGFLGSIIAAAVAPAIIRTPGLLMPIKPLKLDPYRIYEYRGRLDHLRLFEAMSEAIDQQVALTEEMMISDILRVGTNEFVRRDASGRHYRVPLPFKSLFA